MCRVIDVATYAISQAIDFRNIDSDDRYYMDFYKLNKLLYLAQGKMLAQENRTLFKEDIYAYTCGPYIKELEFVFKKWEYELITEPYTQEIPLPLSISTFISGFIKEYGKYNKQVLGIATKRQKPWKESYSSEDNPKVIKPQSIKNYFLEIKDLHREINND